MKLILKCESHTEYLVRIIHSVTTDKKVIPSQRRRYGMHAQLNKP